MKREIPGSHFGWMRGAVGLGQDLSRRSASASAIHRAAVLVLSGPGCANIVPNCWQGRQEIAEIVDEAIFSKQPTPITEGSERERVLAGSKTT